MQTHAQYFSVKTWLSIVAVSGLLAVILYSLGLIGGGEQVKPGTTEHAQSQVAANAELAKVVKQHSAIVQTWPGTVHSRMLTKIAPRAAARILKVSVNSGDRVKKGSVIAELDQRELNAALSEANAALLAAQANAGQAQADARRSLELFQHEATTKANHEAVMARAKTAQAAVEQAQSRIEQLKVNRGDNVLYAPFEGIIVERLKEPGDMGMPGEPVATLMKGDDLRIELGIPAECVSRVQIGETVPVKIDTMGTQVEARYDEIMPDIDPQTGMQTVKAVLPVQGKLHPGQLVWLLQACSDAQEELLIPSRAVSYLGQLETVKVAQGQSVTTRHIRTGRKIGDSVVVLSGLREGEQVVLNQSASAGEVK